MTKYDKNHERIERDYYPTREAWVTTELLKHEQFSKKVLEPAAGELHMANVLRACGYDAVTTDIHAREDLGIGYMDFTKFDHKALRKRSGAQFQCRDVITNPPYGLRGELSDEFILAGLRWIKITGGKFAMLIRAEHDFASGRHRLFKDCDQFAAKYTLTRRIQWFPGDHGGKEHHAWCVWDAAKNPDDAPSCLYI